jgi:hypothetical protein
MDGDVPGARYLPASALLKRRLDAVSRARPALYIFMVIAAAALAYLFQLRRDGIFACQADGYAANAFIAECSAPQYGNYEHGAFWFGLEGEALKAAAGAQVLFLGDSRLQVALSTPQTTDWFSRRATSYHLLGFGAGENMNFTGRLLEKLSPKATAYVINSDRFFETWTTRPAKALLDGSTPEERFVHKRNWQLPHRYICGAAPMLCGQSFVAFRSRTTGMYQMGGDFDSDGNRLRGGVVSYDHSVNRVDVEKYVPRAEQFLSQLGVPRECVILTVVPFSGTRVGTVRALGAALGLKVVSPEPQGLRMFDPTHLDRSSAQTWSQSFYEAAGQELERCAASKKTG